MGDNLLSELLKLLNKNPVIPCTNNYHEIFSDKYKEIRIVFLYDLGLMDLVQINKINMKMEKYIILNLDTLKGISADDEGAGFIKRYLKINIISSTSPKLISSFRKMGFITMQTIHTLDTKSIEKATQLLEIGKPDLIDIRPGILFPRSNIFFTDIFVDIPVVCSGFINNKEVLQEVLNSGAKGVTTSNRSLWRLFL